jgi:uncharacterized protein YggE
MRKSVLIALGALIAVAALFAACGGSDDKGSTGQPQASDIRIGKGLTVANLASQRSGSTGESQDLSLPQTSSGGGAPMPAADGSAGMNAAASDSVLAQQQHAAAQATNETANTGITVQGYGSATADADSAIVEFTFGGGSGVSSPPYPAEDKPFVATPGAATPITRETLQPVIDALTGAGVAASDIELLNQGYYDPYYSSATLRATINNIGSLDGAVEAAQNAAKNVDGITLQGTNISYTLQDCSALERAAAQAAVDDAHDRAVVLADVLNVTLGSVSGANDYSWYQYGTGCGSNYYGPYPIASIAWRAGGSGDGTVQVVSNISVTYAFQ